MKQVIKRIYYTTKSIINDANPKNSNYPRAYWPYREYNFGDILNPVLIKMLTGTPIINIKTEYYKKNHYLAIGSILQYATKYSTIWGSGFISSESNCKEKPLKICAVRGPLTRDKLIKDGIDCPEIYGDPALLLPLVYKPIIKKKYKLGIVPHYVDKKTDWLMTNYFDDTILVIDLINKNPLEVVDEILSCEQIASSSLHGLIISDAYKIPSIWVEFSSNLVGGNFKFIDYYTSVGKIGMQPFIVQNETKLSEIMNQIHFKDITIDLNNLINSSPFDILKKYKK